jgi:uncharacterized protein (TIGR02996 family)
VTERHDENAIVRTVLSRPHDDTPRLVYADWLQDRGEEILAGHLRLFPVMSGGGGGFGDGGDGGGDGGDGGGGDGGDGGGGDGFGYGGYGDGYGGYGGGYGDGGGGYGGYGDGGYGGGYGDGYGGYGDGGYGDVTKTKTNEVIDMMDGLHIITAPGGDYPYVLIGWAIVDGLEAELHGCRILRRFGGSKFLSELAKSGPIQTTELGPPSEVEYFFRPSLGRVIPADEKAWKEHCPKPKGWNARVKK